MTEETWFEDESADGEQHQFETKEESPAPWERVRGAVRRPDGKLLIGRVGAPPQQEATSAKFCFWTSADAIVEKTQLVTCESCVAGKLYTYYSIVDEVHHRSRKKSMEDEVNLGDNDLTTNPPFTSEGYTFATATILRVVPNILTPPREWSPILLAGPDEAAMAYGADEIENKLAVGLIKNGGEELAGPGIIDLDYLLGTNGGHLNVNGSAGRGTKSSFLLLVNWLLLQKARRQQSTRPSDPERLRIVPIILNVKNYDLFYVDHRNSNFEEEKHLTTWEALEFPDPQPFQEVKFLVAQQPGNDSPIATGRTDRVEAYSWSLRDVIERGLISYLFAETDANDLNFSALSLDIENWLTNEKIGNDGSIQRSLLTNEGRPTTFKQLVEWVREQSAAKEQVLKNHHAGTWKKLYRRLYKMVYESRGVLRFDDQSGKPLNLVSADTSDPVVVDLHALAEVPELQRFVVATIFRQLVHARTGARAVKGLVYLVTLDELNRFAPRGAHDPITELVETVAAEMRSQGIILLGAQQQASKVSEKVIENAGIRAIGRTGIVELSATTWSFLTDSAKRKAQSLALDEKLIIQDNFREPMHLRIPFPVWAMRGGEAEPINSAHDKDTNSLTQSDDDAIIEHF